MEMDIAQLAAQAATVLAPFLPFLLKGGKKAAQAAFERVGEKFVDEAWDQAEKLWKKIWPKAKKKEAAKEAVEDIIKEPNDKGALASWEYQLKKILVENPSLATEVSIHIGSIDNTSIRAGDRNLIIGRDVKDATIIHTETYIAGNVYNGPAPRNPHEALKIYRDVLADTTSSLRLLGIDSSASDPTSRQKLIGLSHVYIALDTKTQLQMTEEDYKERRSQGILPSEKTKPLSVLEAVTQNRVLVVKGDPGSGKSTFVNYLTYCLAAQLTEKLEGWKKSDADLLPIIVILRDFAKSLPKKIPAQAEPRHLWEFIVSRLKDQNLSSSSKPILELLEKGKVLFLLDGLDEVPTIEQRAFIRDAIQAFVKRYSGNRYLVTCRILSYQPPKSAEEEDLRLSSFPEFELAPFDDEKISTFIDGWYGELSSLGNIQAEQAREATQRLKNAVKRRELALLAPNPLLLTVMALVNTHKGRLPDKRAVLYDDTIQMLLWRWEQVGKGQDALSKLMEKANWDGSELNRILQELAFEAHSQTSPDDDNEKLAGISESSLQKALARRNKNDLNWAAQVIETMKMRAGLLLERDLGVFTFPHRSFQEYLAGAYLTSLPDFVTRAAQLAENGIIWREVILWAIGCFAHLPGGNIHTPLALTAELCPSSTPSNDLDWQKIWLAGDILLEIGNNRVQEAELGRELLPRIQNRLAQLLEHGALTPRERASAGDTLARLGDPRFDAEQYHLPKESLLGFVHIPAGEFTMGTKAKDIEGLVKKFGGQKDWYEREVEQHTVSLPDYYLARYPVTVAQFRVFAEETKHKLANPESLQGVLNHPVRYVTWFDAVAYCKWLNDKLKLLAPHQKGKNDTEQNFWTGIQNGKLIVTLPSEAEWEKAARGGDALDFPWGNDFEQNNVNNNMVVGDTSAVGCFPQGQSPYKIHDLAGNVWEWTRSLWGKDWQKPEFVYPYEKREKRENMDAPREILRVLRGGAFNNGDRNVRCAYRYRYSPNYRNLDFGFRVVVVSPPISLVPHSGS